MTQEDGPKLLPNALFIKYPNLFYISYHLIFPSLLVKVGVSTKSRHPPIPKYM